MGTIGNMGLSEKYINDVKEYFATLGYRTNWGKFACIDHETKTWYKTLLPIEYVNKIKPNKNIYSHLNFLFILSWCADPWTPLPELPLELIPKFVPDKLQKVG